LSLLETYGKPLQATKSNQDANIEELNKLINGLAYQLLAIEDAINYCGTQSHEIFLDIHSRGSISKPG
jgi:hypothetical protein